MNSLEKRRANKASKFSRNDITFGADNFTQERKDNAHWFVNDPFESYKFLAPQASRDWIKAPMSQREAIYHYTHEYHNINEPLRGLTYYGSTDQKQRGLKRIPEITNILENTSLDEDMWFQRGDRSFASLKKFGLDINYYTDKDIQNLVGKTGVEGAFLSMGSAKGKGFDGDIIYNIYAPKGTKGMYCEPFSAFGNGACSANWDGSVNQQTVSYENEFLMQRGTKFRVAKVEKSGGTWYIDLEVIEQKVVDFPYVNGFPF